MRLKLCHFVGLRILTFLLLFFFEEKNVYTNSLYFIYVSIKIPSHTTLLIMGKN